MISDWQSEPNQQHQNPAERHYQDVKRLTNTLLDRTGAPSSFWFLAMTHACFILNHTVNASIGYTVPMAMLTGVTQDISPLLQFKWYEPVYYREEETAFPSESKESFGWFVGITDNAGHASTFMILSKDANKILYRSVVHTATDPSSKNLRAKAYSDQEPHQFVRSYIDDAIESTGDGETPPSVSMPIIHPEELVGRSFDVSDDDKQMQHIRTVEALKDHEHATNNHPAIIKFKCFINNDGYKEIRSYNQIMDYLSKVDDVSVVWKFNKIVAH